MGEPKKMAPIYEAARQAAQRPSEAPLRKGDRVTISATVVRVDEDGTTRVTLEDPPGAPYTAMVATATLRREPRTNDAPHEVVIGVASDGQEVTEVLHPDACPKCGYHGPGGPPRPDMICGSCYFDGRARTDKPVHIPAHVDLAELASALDQGTLTIDGGAMSVTIAAHTHALLADLVRALSCSETPIAFPDEPCEWCGRMTSASRAMCEDCESGPTEKRSEP